MKDSVRSVDWKFTVTEVVPESPETNLDKSEKSSKKTSFIREERIGDSDEEESEDEMGSSSDLNTRDEIAELESCPDGVG